MSVDVLSPSTSVVVSAGGSSISVAAGFGEINLSANVGGGEGEIYRDKTNATLNLKTLTGSGAVTITNGSNTVDIYVPTSLGDVVGPSSSVDGELSFFSGVTGKLLKGGSGAIYDFIYNLLGLSGGLRLGNTTNETAGNMRWNGTNFQGYTGAAWLDLDKQSSPPGGIDDQLQFNDGGVFGGAGLYWDGSVLGFGGQTSSFPALKRNADVLDIRLADDSDYAKLGVKNISSPTGVTLQYNGVTRVSIGNTAVAFARDTSCDSGYGYGWYNLSKIKSPSSGNIVLSDWLETDFSLLKFGGQTSSFPALKRDGAALAARLADDSAGAEIKSSILTFSETNGRINYTDNFLIYRGAVRTCAMSDTTVDFLGVSNVLLAATSSLSFNTRSSISSPADGDLTLYDNAKTDFGSLKFGGVTSSFPQLKRSGAALILEGADGVGTSALKVKEIDTNGNTTLSFKRNGAIKFGLETLSNESYINFRIKYLTSDIGWNGGTVIKAAVNGNLTLVDWAGTDFGLLQLGGITNAYPALKRVGTALEIKLADDSGYGQLTVDRINFPTHFYLYRAGSVVTLDVDAYDCTVICNYRINGNYAFKWSSKSQIFSPLNGNIKLSNSTDNDFGLLQFGGTTSSYPALKRNGTGIDFRLADDSAYAPITVNSANVAGDLNHDGSNVGFFGVAPVARASAYTPTNVTPDRAFDADTVAVAELADVVGTLIADLQAYGLLQ